MKKRIFLDEDIDASVTGVFGPHDHIHTAKSLRVLGKNDTEVISAAVEKCCLIVTSNQDFLSYYRDHPWRKQGRFFYGLIYLSEQTGFGQTRQIKAALKAVAWKNNRQFDGVVVVRKDGKISREILCCEEHARMFEEQEVARRHSEKIGPSRHMPLKYHQTNNALKQSS